MSVLLYSYIRKEAVLSSQIEGTQSSLSDLLNQIREDGDWEAWLIFFLEGVAVTAHQAFQTATQLLELFKKDREKINAIGRAAPSVLEVHRFFQSHPVSSVRQAHKSIPLSIPTLHASAKQLVTLGILKELPKQGKMHLFSYGRYMEILNKEDDANHSLQ